MLTLDEMKLLAGEIRQLIIDVVSKNGGHLALFRCGRTDFGFA
ncbi:MAG: 1-deoxy-D-xylulose-5-phosphate synthase N-terminal domain-containing protein [Phascolarctobacterium faecium]